MTASRVRMGGGIVQMLLNIKKALSNVTEVDLEYAINVSTDSVLPQYFEYTKGKFHYLPDKKKNIRKYIKELNKILKNKYDCIHVHGSSSTMVIELLCAKRANIPIRIAHCHNSRSDYPFINYIINPIFLHSYTKAVACSSNAGNWIYRKKDFKIIYNGIECTKYKFNLQTRNILRQKYNIDNETLVLGHVGNFVEQKNHSFLIDVFSAFSSGRNTCLFLIGDGPLRPNFEKRVKNSELKNKIFFLGLKNNVDELLQMLDVFLLPSRWEGFPLTVIEAQTAGLPCLLSDAISNEVCLNSDLCKREELSEQKWIKDLEKVRPYPHRDLAIDVIIKKGYDIESLKKQLLKLYEVKSLEKWI